MDKKMTYEQASKRLEEIVNKIESGNPYITSQRSENTRRVLQRQAYKSRTGREEMPRHVIKITIFYTKSLVT